MPILKIYAPVLRSDLAYSPSNIKMPWRVYILTYVSESFKISLMPEFTSSVTEHVADMFVPYCVEAIIMALPFPVAVNWPAVFTDAMDELVEDQFMLLLVASAGSI